MVGIQAAGKSERYGTARKRERQRKAQEVEMEEELGYVGMGGWLNFSSDHVEPIKADHGTQPPPPTSSTFFVLSLFPPRVLAFIHPLSAPPPSPARTRERTRSLSLPSRSRPHVAQSVVHPLRPGAARPSSISSLPSLASSTHSLSGNSLDFFASRGGVIYLAEVERHPRRWSTKRAGVGSTVRGGYIAGE